MTKNQITFQNKTGINQRETKEGALAACHFTQLALRHCTASRSQRGSPGSPSPARPRAFRVAGFQLSDTSLASQRWSNGFSMCWKASSQSLAARVGIREAGWVYALRAPRANSPWPADTAAPGYPSLERLGIFSYSEEIITKTGNRSAHSGFNTLPRELC